MPRKKEVEVYEFDELSKKAKEKALSDFRPDAWGQDDSDMLTETFQEILKEKGLPSEVYWGLNYAQGDGVAFYGPINISDYIKKNKLNKFRALSGKVEGTIEGRESRYHHSYSMRVDLELKDPLIQEGPKEWLPGAPSETLIREFQEHIQDHVKKVSRELEKIGYGEIEYRTGDEAIAEFFEANEYEFLEDGTVWNR